MKIFTMDSFGDECPRNWEEICDALNQVAERQGIDPDSDDPFVKDEIDRLWEKYCLNGVDGVPDPEFD